MKAKQKKKKTPGSPVVSVAKQAITGNRPGLFPVMASMLLIVGFLSVAYARNTVYHTPVTLWRDASSKSFNKRRTHENFGQALSTAGLYNEAITQFKTVLALHDDGSVPMRDLYREIGVVYFRIGLIPDAINSWQTGLEYAPHDPSLLNNLTVAYLQQRRYDEAERSIREALMGAPYMPQALNSLGEILMMKGRYSEALEYFLKAIQSSPEEPARYWNAALAYEKTGRYDMALDYANQYIAREGNLEMKQRGVLYINRLKSLYFAKPQ